MNILLVQTRCEIGVIEHVGRPVTHRVFLAIRRDVVCKRAMILEGLRVSDTLWS